MFSKSRLANSLRRFHQNEEGSLTIESIMSVALAGGIMYIVWKVVDGKKGTFGTLIDTILNWAGDKFDS